jgi:hypothetical protein
MMDAISEPGTIQAALSLLIGQRLPGTRNLFATRLFYFGQENLDDPNPGESCEANAPNPQNRKLAELRGDLRGELAVDAGARLVVESVHPEMCCGFRIDLGEACVREVAGAPVLMRRSYL